jgi:hypothetical protein
MKGSISGKMTVAYLVKKLAVFMETEFSLPHAQERATATHFKSEG